VAVRRRRERDTGEYRSGQDARERADAHSHATGLPTFVPVIAAGIDTRAVSCKLKRVLNYSDSADVVFLALADPTRRRIVEQLGSGPATVSTLAAPLPMSLPAVVQHLKILEASGLVRSEKVGRVRTCHLEVRRLDTVQDWIADRQRSWEKRLDRLGEYLAEQADQAKKEPK
jgi:DNA-binding transcriptional ArsR family regulator